MKTKKKSEIAKQIESRLVKDKQNKKSISFSQYSIYAQCPHRWYLSYAKELYPFTSNMNTVFGSAMHETFQNYLKMLYSGTAKAADEFDSYSFFEDRLKQDYLKEVSKNKGKHFSTAEEMNEFYEDGCAIFKWFKRKRKSWFKTKGEELIGCEIPLFVSIDGSEIYFNGYLDIIIYDQVLDRIIIKDLKTSTRGWKDKEKKDELKTAQLILYKKYFSDQYGIDIDKVDVEFIILKRKIYQESEFPQPRMSKFRPASGTPTINKVITNINRFVRDCFNDDGTCIDKVYPKNPGMVTCQWCPFLNQEQLCDRKN